MSELGVKLLNLIEQNATLDEISSILNLSRSQIYEIFCDLKLMGIDFNRKYYCNGEVVYIPKKGIDFPCKKNEVNIITETGSDIFRCIVISDLHIGSAYQNEDAWNKIMDYLCYQ